MTRDVSIDLRLDRVASECIAARVRLINRIISAVYDEALRPHGLRISQANILVCVGRLGEVRAAEICRLLQLERSTLSRDVEIMKRKGWLRSEPPGGGRNHVLRVTPRGLKLLARSYPDWESAQAEAARLIGEPGVAGLRRIAEKLGFGTPDV